MTMRYGDLPDLCQNRYRGRNRFRLRPFRQAKCPPGVLDGCAVNVHLLVFQSYHSACNAESDPDSDPDSESDPVISSAACSLVSSSMTDQIAR
jgi:hypothetical protein